MANIKVTKNIPLESVTLDKYAGNSDIMCIGFHDDAYSPEVPFQKHFKYTYRIDLDTDSDTVVKDTISKFQSFPPHELGETLFIIYGSFDDAKLQHVRPYLEENDAKTNFMILALTLQDAQKYGQYFDKIFGVAKEFTKGDGHTSTWNSMAHFDHVFINPTYQLDALLVEALQLELNFHELRRLRQVLSTVYEGHMFLSVDTRPFRTLGTSQNLVRPQIVATSVDEMLYTANDAFMEAMYTTSIKHLRGDGNVAFSVVAVCVDDEEEPICVRRCLTQPPMSRETAWKIWMHEKLCLVMGFLGAIALARVK
tara:strand:+ start:3934 stop:4863 length:930 start_codon:yes stop_codon:yes gene_type:complete